VVKAALREIHHMAAMASLEVEVAVRELCQGVAAHEAAARMYAVDAAAKGAHVADAA
jgi:hypothetical protein